MVTAQTPEPLPAPDFKLWTNGAVNVVARAPDGSTVFGGSFLAVNGVLRSNIARLRPDGALDQSWNPGSNGTVTALAIDADGSVFVGGAFSVIGGLSRDRLAKLSATGTGDADVNWNPGADAMVNAMLLDGNGAIYIGGHFTFVNGFTRNRLAKLATTGSALVDSAWNPDVGGTVQALAYDGGAGSLYLAGNFTSVAGTPRAFIARVSASGTGTLDPVWNPGSNNGIYSLQLDAGDWLYAAGYFDNFAGQAHAGVARVSKATGAGDSTWSPGVGGGGGGVSSIALSNTHLYLAGGFAQVNAQTRANLARVSTVDGSLDATFSPMVNAALNHVATFGDGVVFIGSSGLTTVNDQVRLALARLDSTGSALAATDAMSRGTVFAMVPLSSGGAIVGGDFYFADAVPRSSLLKMEASGAIDPNWSVAIDGPVSALALDPDAQSIYVAGAFQRVNALPHQVLAKVAVAAGAAVDPGWKPAPNGSVQTIAVDDSGSVYVGGSFQQIAGGARSNIAKLTSDTAVLDTGWGIAGANSGLSKIAIAPDGSVFASGIFSTINGQPRVGLAKLDPLTGAADPNWSADLGPSQLIRTALFSGTQMYIGGDFTSVNGIPRDRLAKLSVTSPMQLDTLWTPGASSDVNALQFGPADSLYVAGDFTVITGQLRIKLAKITALSDGALDADWAPWVVGAATVNAMVVNSAGNIVIGGAFNEVGTQARQSIAAVPPANLPPDPIFDSGFE